MDPATLSVLARAVDASLGGGYLAAAVVLPVSQTVVLRLQRDDESSPEDDRDLSIFLDAEWPLLWTGAARPRPNPDPLAETLTAWAVGRRLEAVACDPRDRTVDVRLGPRPGGKQGGVLRLRLFGSRPRILVMEGGEILHRYPAGGGAAQGAREARRPWVFDPDPADASDEMRSLLDSEAPASEAGRREAMTGLARGLRGCGPALAREVLARAAAAGAPLSGGLASLREEFEGLVAASPLHLYLRQGAGRETLGRLSALRMTHLETKDVRHTQGEPIPQAARWAQIVAKQRALALLQRRRLALVRPLQKSMTRLAKKLVEEGRRGDDAERWRQWAQALLVHAARIEKGTASARVADPEDPARELEIPLDPKLTPAENADAYFRKARREERARPVRERRLRLVESLVAHLYQSEEPETPRAWRNWVDRGDKLLGKDESADAAQRDVLRKWTSLREKILVLLETPDASRALEDVVHRLLPASEAGRKPSPAPGRAPRPSARRKAGAAHHPRRFVTKDGWSVFVGRTNKENDYITHSLAKPDDYWFHVHGAPGSHVVLRRGGRKDNPSAKTLEEVASIAARYSQAKNSRRVPVIYTLKKYVRKPRKAPPGLALCMHEKTLMVEPADEATLRAMQVGSGDA